MISCPLKSDWPSAIPCLSHSLSLDPNHPDLTAILRGAPRPKMPEIPGIDNQQQLFPGTEIPGVPNDLSFSLRHDRMAACLTFS